MELKKEENPQNMQIVGFKSIVGEGLSFEDVATKKIKKKKKKHRTYEMLLTKKNIIAKIQDRIDNSDKIPKTLKRRYKAIEIDPLKLLVINLPFDITPEEIGQFFNTFLVSLDSSLQSKRLKPVIECDMGATKKFAVLSMLNLECVWKLLKVESFSFKNSLLRLIRPKGFFAKHFESGNYTWDENGNLLNLDEGEECKIYLGNLPQYLSEENIRKMVEFFGPLKSFQMKLEPAINGESISKGYCILEYQNITDAEKAISSLAGQVVGDKELRIQKMVDVGHQKSREKAQVAPTTEIQTSFLLMFPKLRDPQVQAMLAASKTCTTPSRVVQLLNMFQLEDLFEETFYQQLITDLQEECKKYGVVERIDVTRPHPLTGGCSPSVGKVFVKFADLTSARQAQHRLNGRTYMSRTIVCSFTPEEKWVSLKAEAEKNIHAFNPSMQDR